MDTQFRYLNLYLSIFLSKIFKIFFYCYLAAPLSFSRDSLTNPMLITVFVQFWPEGHREPSNEVGSLSPVERLVGFEPEIFRLQHLNPLGHSPQINLQVSSQKLSILINILSFRVLLFLGAETFC